MEINHTKKFKINTPHIEIQSDDGTIYKMPIDRLFANGSACGFFAENFLADINLENYNHEKQSKFYDLSHKETNEK